MNYFDFLDRDCLRNFFLLVRLLFLRLTLWSRFFHWLLFLLLWLMLLLFGLKLMLLWLMLFILRNVLLLLWFMVLVFFSLNLFLDLRLFLHLHFFLWSRNWLPPTPQGLKMAV
jgi:hypothetical protein